jgi:HAD superfamily hydrolase (TIGR01509 family)
MLNLNDITAAVFDLDGTLIDSNEAWLNTERIILERNNIYVPEETLARMVLMTYSEIYPELKKLGLPYEFDEMVALMDELVFNEYENNITLKDSAEEFIRHIRNKGMKTAVATNSTRRLVDAVLRQNRAEDLFDVVMTFEDSKEGDKDAEFYLQAARLLGVSPDHCMVFEDRFIGIDSAKKAGMKTVSVYDRFSQLDFFKARGYADQYIYSFADMLSEHKATLIGEDLV